MSAPEDGEAEAEGLRTKMAEWRQDMFRAGPTGKVLWDEKFVEVDGLRRMWMWTEQSRLSSGCGGEYIV